MPGPEALSLMRKLSRVEPTLGSTRIASVAVMLEGSPPKTLLIERAERVGDPWSGQVAFPGGKMQDRDATVRETAIREAREEVGIDLDSTARFLGYLGKHRTHTGNMDVIPTVFSLEKEVEVRLNEEATSYRWVDLGDFGKPSSQATHTFRRDGAILEMPAFHVGGYEVWGLTYRIIQTILSDEP